MRENNYPLEPSKPSIRIGISSIGSGIGQSVIHSLRLSGLPLETIGFGNGKFEYGALECDRHFSVPAIRDPSYVDNLLDQCREQDVQILIPGLDGDLQILSEQAEQFEIQGIRLLSAPAELVALCRDKALMTARFRQVSDRFVESFTKEKIRVAVRTGRLQLPCIAKPRDGSGSTGITLIEDLEEAQRQPDGYIFQELLVPAEGDPYRLEYSRGLGKGNLVQVSEVSIQLVAGREGEFLGRLATVNRLKNGVPIEIFPVDRPEIWEAVDPILEALLAMGLRGPVNIQGRFTDRGLRFFEVNPRFTGITGLRAMLGFNEVEACLKSWLDRPADTAPYQSLPSKFGLRQVADRIHSVCSHAAARDYSQELNPERKTSPRSLLLTGSTGYLGRALLEQLSGADYRIQVLTGAKNRAREILNDLVSDFYDHQDLQAGRVSWGSVDLLVHCGFARPFRGTAEIARSLAFTGQLFQTAGMFEISAVINISSQSVYSQDQPPPWREDTPVSPSSNYGTAKYAAELMLSSVLNDKPHLCGTSLRLAGLTGGSPGLVPVDLVTRFVQQALRGEPLEIWGDHQFERLDVRDAAAGIAALLSVPPQEWQEVYNLGQGGTFSIRELASWTAEEVSQHTGEPPVPIWEDWKDQPLHLGMDSGAFFELTGWTPQYSLRESISSLITYLENPAD